MGALAPLQLAIPPIIYLLHNDTYQTNSSDKLVYEPI